ncbi:Arc family DNA-binding protein [Pseudomonas guariconensis]|uniref:Arc family DNA-binding protein n=1 Tax=Pseudomonas guariconensis TaxID=1288410 RepID=UPI0021D423E1|nr:Arc family DNA-binding protein [Pseudomonas guariconensis]
MSDRHVLPPYSLRMPADLREKLESSAKYAKRSLNAEIIARLEESYAHDQAIFDQEAYETWAKENSIESADQSIVLALSQLRFLLSSAEEGIRKVERLYDEKTGEHAITADADGNIVKSYER